MKIYFDESGQSGCVLLKKDLLNFQKQPTFAIGAVVARTDEDAGKLITKYSALKQKFNIDGELKGSDLLTRARNSELEYVLKNVLDSDHFFVLLYDKRFYISTLLLLSLLGFEYQYLLPEHFYQQASFLSQQKDDFFIRYLHYIERPSVLAFSDYLQFLIDYEYSHVESTENAVVTMAKKIIEEQIVDKCCDDFLTFGSYDDPKITNLINLTALSELIFFIKSQLGATNEEILYVHDHITEFENTIQRELHEYGIDIVFADSENEVLLQVADNAVSLLRHTYDRCIAHFRANEQWNIESEWDMKLMSKVIKKMSAPHISFSVPLYDWAMSLCIEIMFDPRYPRKYRNNIHFNHYYMDSMKRIFESIQSNNRPLDEVVELLKK